MTSSCTRRRRTSAVLAALVGLTLTLAVAATAQAQVVNDPRIAEFDPSPDHWQTLDSGEPAVVRYELGVYIVGASAPFATIDIGKPSPDADGKIRYDFASGVAGWPLTGSYYEARISAVGPEGAALSDPSNPFVFGGASSCVVSLSATTPQVPAPGGDYAVDVFTGDGCAWRASTALSWVTLLTSSGSGNGMVAFALQANTSTAARTGTITIGAQTLTVRQQGLAIPATSWAKPAAITQGTPLGAAQLNAIASVPGTFVYIPAAGTVLASGTHTLRAIFTPNDMARYAKATVSTTITVGPTVYQLTVSRPSGGTIYSAGIKCGTVATSCRVTMPAGMQLGLEAAPDAGYAFSGWTGDCAGTSRAYALQLNGSKTCGAAFSAIPSAPSTNPPPESPTSGTSTTGGTTAPPPVSNDLPLGAPYTLTVSRPSGGVVKAAGINCGATTGSCSVSMPAAMTLGLDATPAPGYVFAGWTGHCSGSGAAYLLALEGPRTCGASFVAAGGAVATPAPPTAIGTPLTGAPFTLTVTRPSGGTIQAAGIKCGTSGVQCSVTMPASMLLGLEVTPDPGYAFTGWIGDCRGTQRGYLLTLSGPRTCGATFVAAR